MNPVAVYSEAPDKFILSHYFGIYFKMEYRLATNTTITPPTSC